MFFENVAVQQPFARKSEAFYNPEMTKKDVTIEGIPNQLYSQGLRDYQMWDEAKKYLAPGSKSHPELGTAAKDLLFTWLSPVMSMMVSFCAVFFSTWCLG